MGTLSPNPWDLPPWGNNGSLTFREVSASLSSHWSAPKHTRRDGQCPPHHCRGWVGAQVASLRSLVLRSVAINIAETYRAVEKYSVNGECLMSRLSHFWGAPQSVELSFSRDGSCWPSQSVTRNHSGISG